MGCGRSAILTELQELRKGQKRLEERQQELQRVLNQALAAETGSAGGLPESAHETDFQILPTMHSNTSGHASLTPARTSNTSGHASLGSTPLHGRPSFSYSSRGIITSTMPHRVREEGRYDVFVSHCKRLPESEDRAVWISDVCEANGLFVFFDRSDLIEISEESLEDHVRRSNCIVTVLDPVTYDSMWVMKEHICAFNEGIPIICVYDSDRFRWEGQLDRWAKLYPWIFHRQVVTLAKSQRRATAQLFFSAVVAALEEPKKKPEIGLSTNALKFAILTEVRIAVGGSRETDTMNAVESAHNTMMSRCEGAKPSLIIATFTCMHEAYAVAETIHKLSPSAPMLGCTSCRGVITNDTWLTYKGEYAVGMWCICDDAGSFQVMHLKDRPDDLEAAVRQKMRTARRLRVDQPSFVVLLGSPGDEEIVLKGIVGELGDVPILGGSSADNHVTGQWKQISKTGASGFNASSPELSQAGITFAIGWTSCDISTTLTSGFRQTCSQGKITKVDPEDHGRTILEIDGRPARDVYNEWTKGELTKGLVFQDGVGNVLAPTSFMPLGEPCTETYSRVLHPAYLHQKNGSLTTFADSYEGMNVMLLEACPETLAKTMTHGAMAGLKNGCISLQDCCGALMIFCGGLVMAIDDLMPVTVEHIAAALGHKNAMGICCFGEQGMNHEKIGIHGNLMFGCLVFGNQRRKRNESRSSRTHLSLDRMQTWPDVLAV